VGERDVTNGGRCPQGVQHEWSLGAVMNRW
jgi:hypothetical protein